MDQIEPQPIFDEIPSKININLLPKHKPEKFIEASQSKSIDPVYEDGHEVGFMIKGENTVYELDYEEGFFEPNGCYYSRDFVPKGWWVLDKDSQEFFYDIDGKLDGEDEEDENENEQLIQQQ
ncbi:unnamed protein product (macronuclear) [Paramecium tetraurelia]|uniref:OCRE domain-containing protein n=1 Tax=Paramecium tetraurelia TaxID=5888 RepID=A0E546_PARTE|nr:uncharacterized protein GSPATT00023590001 [Paramecium tetraurelia]CAK90413.1 unnamed protein product [Paramecium tetraurelia]|eukprot:XP_001457810.1 hypothetical protein (macronuclear) [Paramecium tetraurelia strain d4-2]